MISLEQVHIHTSDRISFKRCRRKWGFCSPLRRNLEPITKSSGALWLGSGIHWALEDYHGYKRCAGPLEALKLYYKAFPEEQLPVAADDLYQTGCEMLEHYLQFTKKNFEYRTVWIEGIPQVEIGFSIPLPEANDEEHEVFYHGTFDRVVSDEFDNWYILDYKTAAAIDTDKLSTDPQISAYMWAAEQHYGRPIAGMIYLQMSKSTPAKPKVLKSGDISKDKGQKTTHAMYRQALIDTYGKVPEDYIDVLNHFAELVTPEGDGFIRIDVVVRNKAAKKAVAEHTIAEAKEMLNPKLALYPNPTRDCKWDCSVRTICMAIEEGGEYESWIGYEFQERNQSALNELPDWRVTIEKMLKGGKQDENL